MNNFTFGHNVFKSRPLLLYQNASASGKVLRDKKYTPDLVEPVHGKGYKLAFLSNVGSDQLVHLLSSYLNPHMLTEATNKFM